MISYDYTATDQLPLTSGIYGFMIDGVVIYIGQAKNIRKRVKQHLDWKCDLRSILCDISAGERQINDASLLAIIKAVLFGEHKEELEIVVFAEAPLNELNQLEYDYITAYQPELNYAGVKMAYRPVEGRGPLSMKGEKHYEVQ